MFSVVIAALDAARDYFPAVYAMGGAIFIPSLCDIGVQVVEVKNPRSRPRQGFPLDREQRPPTCHPLGPSPIRTPSGSNHN